MNAASSSLVDARRAEVILRRHYLRHVKIIFPAVTVYYLVLALAHSQLMPPDIRPVMMALALSAALIGALSSLAAFSGAIRLRWAHASFLPMGFAALINIYAHIYLSGEQIQLTNGVLSLMAFGFLVLSPPLFWVMTAISLLAYAALLVAIPGPYTAHFAFMAFTGLLLGVVAFLSRTRSLRQQILLTLENRQRGFQFQQQKRAAEAASAAKSRFLANTSHELRTPLTGIIGMLGVLAKTPLTDEQRNLVAVADTSAEGLLRVLNDILDSAALESGRMRLESKDFDVETVIEGVRQVLLPRADEKRLTVAVSGHNPHGLRLYGDGIRLGQIVFNLVGNAIKFTDAGTVSIDWRIDWRGEWQTGSRNPASLTIAVSDTGPGIPASEQDKLFERFHQIDDSYTRRHGGTGLGLAITREIVDLLEGDISVDSAPGEGTRFTVSLSMPVADNALTDMPQDSADLDEALASAAGRPLRLLVAEDNKVNQMLITRVLDAYPAWSVTLVGDGAQAVEALNTTHSGFDVMILDIQMPEMTGLEALAAIRAAKGADAPPAIALTANVAADDLAAYRTAGFRDTVAKPIQPDRLYAAIALAVDQRASPDEGWSVRDEVALFREAD